MIRQCRVENRRPQDHSMSQSLQSLDQEFGLAEKMARNTLLATELSLMLHFNVQRGS